MADSICTQSKRVCVSNDGEEKGQEDDDCISNLPDSILCHILSFLPTKVSVSTSILSKRWIDLWTAVPALSFDSTALMGNVVHSVDRVITMCRAQTIYQFSLDLEYVQRINAELLHTWINAAIIRNVQELELILCASSEPRFRLPDHVFACKSLVCLKLFGDILVDVPANVCFQSLRILQLEGVRYGNDGCLNRLLSSCPILEDFIVKRIWADGISDICINVPSLKRMNVKSSRDYFAYNLLINAPLLERIELGDTNIWDFQVEGFSNLLEVIIHNGGQRMHIKGLGNVKFLSLSESVVMALHSDLGLPVFCNLICLEITINCAFSGELLDMLKCSDYLKTLVLHVDVPSYHLGRRCSEYRRMTVPKCVSMSLKTFKFTGFCGHECSWKFIQYILENAKLLKQMKIGTSSRSKKRRHRLRNMLKYPRASMECEIGFFDDSSGQEFHL